KSPYDIYLKYKSNIIAYSIKDNEFGGFYVKEFIDQKTFFKMLLKTNSIFSNKFKDDLSEILDTLMKNNQLTIKNDKLQLTNLHKDLLEDNTKYDNNTFDNLTLTNFIKEEISKCKNMIWNKYADKHVLYFCMTLLTDPDDKNRPICKIGYTQDIIERIKS